MARMLAALLACVVVTSTAVSSASAQIIYEPVRYQYGGQTPFYYGGNDPDMFRFAHREYAESRNGFATAHGNVMTHREVSSLAPHVYVDHMPRANAAIYGYTADDARNDAYNNAPRYFRKKDLLAHAVQDSDGAWHVPAQVSTSSHAGTIEIKPYVRPVTSPHPVIVIPKEMLDRKIEAPKQVTMAVE